MVNANMERFMKAREQQGYVPPFRLQDFVSLTEIREGRGPVSEAMVKLQIGEKLFHTAAEGVGPVDALNKAARKALEPVYPELKEVHLVDYSVSITDGAKGTEAEVFVSITFSSNEQEWRTTAFSQNIIEASWNALSDGFTLFLWASNNV